mmetsp:Transcript_59768/g.163826  ORF Transcript_59768/g.163826 Transcript_59768/m.163826 type:complete len:141 (-) Transcript_59768:220-642(-)
MKLFGSRRGHQRLESGDATNEVEQSAGAQAAVRNMCVPKGETLGCTFNHGNYIMSVTKGSIAALKDLKEGDLIVQVNGVATEGKQVVDMIKGEEQLAITILRPKGGVARSSSESMEWTDGGGTQDDVKKQSKLDDAANGS